ncbi:hypothetical protein S245_056184, partial [Arachis hypogaea]
HSERGFGADAVALAEEIWKASERESLKAPFKAIRSHGTDSHVVPRSASATINDSKKVSRQDIELGHNIILISNHQTEADPAVIALLIEKKAPHLAENMTYVAGDRVVTDPLCKPFSIGRCWWLYLFTRATLVGWLVSMIVGEVENFMAYTYAPAILVTLLGAISIIVRQSNMLVYLKICSLMGSFTALLIYLDKIFHPVVAVILSVTFVLAFGEVIPEAICSRYGLYVGSNFVGLVQYGELHSLNKQEIANRYGKEQVHEWRRSYDTPPPNGESLEMYAEREVAYFRDQ